MQLSDTGVALVITYEEAFMTLSDSAYNETYPSNLRPDITYLGFNVMRGIR